MIKKLWTTIFFCHTLFNTSYSKASDTNLSKSVLKSYQGIQSEKDLLVIFKDYMTPDLRHFLTKMDWKKLKKEVSISSKGEALLLTSGKEKATIEFINNKVWINNLPWTFDPWKSPAMSIIEIQEILKKKKKSAFSDIFEKLFFERANAGVAVVIAVSAITWLFGGTALHWATKAKCAKEEKDLNMPTPELSCKLRTIWPFSDADNQVVKVGCKKSDAKEYRLQEFDQVTLLAANGEEITATSIPSYRPRLSFDHSDATKKKNSYLVTYESGVMEGYLQLGVPYWPQMEMGKYWVNGEGPHDIYTEPLMTLGKGMVETTKKILHYIDMCNNDPGTIKEINEQGNQISKVKTGSGQTQ